MITGETGKREVIRERVDRSVLGQATFRRLANPVAPTRSSDVSKALKWAVNHFGISQEIALACLKEHRVNASADEAKRKKEEA